MKSLWKWCTVVVIAITVLSVLVGTPGGKAQDSAWTTKVIAEGPDASKRRVIYPDIDAVGDWVIVGYIDQSTETVKAAVSSDRGQNFQTFDIAKAGRVIGASVVDIALPDGSIINCFNWITDAFEVWVVCWQFRSGSAVTGKPLGEPVRLSTEGVPAGQHDFQGDWTGNLDGAARADGEKFVFYEIWTENYDTLKAAKSTDGVNWTACGAFPDQDPTFVRFPTIYVDTKGRVYAGTTQTASPADVWVWVSYDGCASWKGPTNVTANSGFSDAPSFAVIGDKFYSVNDETTTNPNNVDLNFAECDVTADAGLANCKGTRAAYKDAAWAVQATDGTNLHLTGNGQGSPGDVVYCFSSNGGQTWIGDHVPNSKPNVPGVRDPDFGITISRNRIAAGPNGGAYIAWMTRREGKSMIMLSIRTAPPTGTASATCLP